MKLEFFSYDKEVHEIVDVEQNFLKPSHRARLQMSRTTNMFERKAQYSLLAAISDVGGFSYLIVVFISILLSPYSYGMYEAAIAQEVKTPAQATN